MPKQTKKQLREEVKHFLTIINAEGGSAEYFTGYSDPESLAQHPFVPESFIAAARGLAAAHQKLEQEIKKLREEHGIDETETEY